MKKLYKYIILFFLGILFINPCFSQTKYNFIIEKVYNDNISNTSISYFDGLGRPIQSIQVAASPNGNDMVQHIDYDNLGRESKKYLPYVSTYAGGFYRTNAESEQDAFYKSEFKSSETVNPWATIEFEESPLNRVLQQGAPGTAWQPVKGSDADNAVHFAYETNNSEISRFEINTDNSLTKVDNYASATLYKNGSRDENGVWNYEYKNMLGQVVLKVSDPDGLNLRTCYVYDDFGLLRYVIPPKAVELIGTSGITQDIINNLCYYYQYDGRKRMIIKRLPGAEDVYMVYDQRDRLVLTQDGNLRTRNEWMFTKYDQLDRPIMTGIYQHETLIDQKSMQVILENQMVETEDFYEIYNGDIDGRDFFGYTMDHSFPVSLNNEILTVTYYDNYDFDVNPIGTYDNVRAYAESIDNTDYPKSLINNRVKSLVTGTLTKVLGSVDHYLLSMNFYDNEYRVIRTYAENYLGGDDLLLSKYDFIGNVKKTKQVHFKDGVTTTPITINQRFEYDHANRLTQVYHQIEGNSEILLAEMEYNELGQLVKKKLNENADGSFLQEIDFTYNIRGWLTSINNPDNLGNDKFAMELLYNNVLPTVNNTGDEQFNGNIAAIKWNTPEFGVKAYGYGYDNINRLERAKFAAGIALNADVNKYSVENITYDANGNILTLGRHNTTTSYIDNLEMTYNGNQLKKTYDSGDLVLGFVDMVDYETEYHYDLNGNMDVDDNKGFVFAYNYLNLPEEVVGGTDTVRYIYDATGIKMSKELVQGGAISYTNYVGNFVYKDGDLDYIVTDEGRITQPTAGTFQYEYFLKDHLGNTRTVFADGNGDGLLADNEVLQETHYYPFGMSIGDLAVDRGADNKIKYNGKELQDDELGGVKLNLMDYGFRFYDPALGRFHAIDPLTDFIPGISPYNYALNNPITLVDAEGLWPWDPEKKRERKLDRQNRKRARERNREAYKPKNKGKKANPNYTHVFAHEPGERWSPPDMPKNDFAYNETKINIDDEFVLEDIEIVPIKIKNPPLPTINGQEVTATGLKINFSQQLFHISSSNFVDKYSAYDLLRPIAIVLKENPHLSASIKALTNLTELDKLDAEGNGQLLVNRRAFMIKKALMDMGAKENQLKKDGVVGKFKGVEIIVK